MNLAELNDAPEVFEGELDLVNLDIDLTKLVKDAARARREDQEHFEKYKDLIHLWVVKTLPRAIAVEPSIEHDDLFALYSEVYVRCRKAYEASRGAFSTYLTNSIYFRFNKWMVTMMKERANVSAYTVEAHQERFSIDGADQMDPYSRIKPQEHQDDYADPCEAVSLKQQIVAGFPSLSWRTRKVVTLLVRPTDELRAHFQKSMQERREAGKSVSAEINMRFVVEFLGFGPKERSLIRAELKEVYGVDFKSLPQ